MPACPASCRVGLIDESCAEPRRSGDLPKLAANDRARATAEEARAVVAGSVAYYGTYSVDEANKTVTARVEGSTFANLIGGALRVAAILEHGRGEPDVSRHWRTGFTHCLNGGVPASAVSRIRSMPRSLLSC